MVDVLIHTVETTVLTPSFSQRHHSGRRASRHRTPVGTAVGRWSFDPADPQSWQQHREIVDTTHDKQSIPFTKSSATLALVQETTAQFVYSNNLLPQYIENIAMGVGCSWLVCCAFASRSWHMTWWLTVWFHWQRWRPCDSSPSWGMSSELSSHTAGSPAAKHINNRSKFTQHYALNTIVQDTIHTHVGTVCSGLEHTFLLSWATVQPRYWLTLSAGILSDVWDHSLAITRDACTRWVVTHHIIQHLGAFSIFDLPRKNFYILVQYVCGH